MTESSTALQKKNAEVPSSRRMMKSPMSLDENRCGPCTTSVNSMIRSSARRSAASASSPAPRARRAAPPSAAGRCPRSAAACPPCAAACATAPALPPCSSTDRPGPRASRRANKAPIEVAALRLRVRRATGRRYPAPRPSPGPASAFPPSTASRKRGSLRSTSVSSMRKMKRPPLLRAHRWLKKAVRAFPRCREPVGLGANRVMTGDESS